MTIKDYHNPCQAELDAALAEIERLKVELDGFKYSLVSAANAKLMAEIELKDKALITALEWFTAYRVQAMSRNNAEQLADEAIEQIKAVLK